MAADTSSGAAKQLMPSFRGAFGLLTATYDHWRATRTLRMGAGLAYYTLFAIVPLMSLAAAIVARLISNDLAEQFVTDALDGLIEGDAAAVASTVVDEISTASTGLGLLGFATVLISASFLFAALQDALNVIWEAPVRVGWRNTIRRRLVAIGAALAVAAYFVASLVINAVVGLAERLVPGDLPVIESISELIGSTATWVIGILTIALLFRSLPYVAVRWRDAIVGAAITAGFVAIGSWLVGIYLSRFFTTSITGAAGGAVLFLVLVYYEAQILLAGAVLTTILGGRSAGRFSQERRDPAGEMPIA
ncbi:MAG TPA: YihY/virulence factor BrkB family protein [Acidimicrobiia bacterium]|nr:YihY/virulence factor BrkB family protein [Acidimicrobiia bacterium]